MKKYSLRILSLLFCLILLLSAVPSAQGYEVGDPWKVDL